MRSLNVADLYGWHILYPFVERTSEEIVAFVTRPPKKAGLFRINLVSGEVTFVKVADPKEMPRDGEWRDFPTVVEEWSPNLIKSLQRPTLLWALILYLISMVTFVGALASSWGYDLWLPTQSLWLFAGTFQYMSSILCYKIHNVGLARHTFIVGTFLFVGYGLIEAGLVGI